MSTWRALRACLVLALLLLAVVPSMARADFGIKSFSVSALEENGSVDTRAGSRPYSFRVGLEMNLDEEEKPGGALRSVIVELPPGLVGNPVATPRCTGAQFEGEISFCPGNTQVGVARVSVIGAGEASSVEVVSPVFNLVPPLGVPAAFGFSVLGNLSLQEASLRTGSDYGANVSDVTLPTNLEIQSVTEEIWGAPADDRHDPERQCINPITGLFFVGCGVEITPTPFLTLPTSCSGPLEFTVKVESLQEPGVVKEANAVSRDEHGDPVGLDSCSKPPFKPTIAAQPETSVADSPSGLHVNLHLPQNDEVTQEELEPRDEVQQLQVDAASGSFVLSFENKSTGEIPFNASAAEVQSALQALETIGAGNVLVSGASSPYAITFINALSEQDVPPINALFTGEGKAKVSVVKQGRGEGLLGSDPMIATAHLKDTVVALPAGLSVNPSSADGLGACSAGQIDLHGPGPAHCPESSKLGGVSVNTPLLDHPVKGAVYLAKQGENPFGSLIAIYVAVEDPITGVVVKLAGQVEPNPVTGRLVTRFKENPQLPFEDFELDFTGGPRAALTTPPTCGTYTTTTDLTPWTSPEGADAFPSSPFPITASPGGGGCAGSETGLINNPQFKAGTATALGGAFSPFVLKLGRENGSQRFGALNVTLPPGLSAKLAGVTECSEAQIAAAQGRSNPGQGALEQASPSCPAASEVGVVNVGAGSGSLLYVQGHAYLAGPYKGAPLSLAIITPALAGPFDLGVVVVRSAIYVDETTAQVTVKSDPLPTILQGIPLDVRSVAVKVDRPEFSLNPSSCEEMAVSAEAIATTGQVASLKDRFKLLGCRKLDFSPKLSLQMKGATRRSGHPAFKAVLTQPKDQANIARTTVILPPTAFIDQNHIANPCTRVQFNENDCPPGSVLGKARAFTPLLDKPLEGLLYFRSNGGERELPDLVADLHGKIHLVLVGFVDSVHKKGSESSRVRTTFASIPDAPVSKAVFQLKGGKKGLLVNSANICKVPNVATVKMKGHNGKLQNANQRIGTGCRTKK
ncbi:MAG: hypothetical protein WBL45_03245 [Solirubrobacterales bacterium]